MNTFTRLSWKSNRRCCRLLFGNKHWGRFFHDITLQTACYETTQPVIGQPSPLTHPHLLKPNELVPGFTKKDFIERRDRLAEALVRLKPNGTHLVLIPAAMTQYMSDKIPYVFRQNTDFRYLTGCLEPDSALLLIIKPDGSHKSKLFMRDKNAHTELWEGPRTGVDVAPQLFGIDEAKSINALESELKESAKNCTFWYDFRNPAHRNIHNSVVSFLSNSGSKCLESPIKLIHELRLIKSKAEQDLMLRSAQITSDAITQTIRNTEVGHTEHQLFAMVDYHCRMNGAEYLAYPPVVAAGNNANIIHYINNTQKIMEGELILMDAGCELHGYCSDITRTWPVSKQFTPLQQTLYEIVLDVQTNLISLCSEEKSLDELFKLMCVMLGKRLKEAHVLTKAADSMTLEEMAFKFCPHHVSHYLGMDVHDTGTINRTVHLQEGMVITVEPVFDLYCRDICQREK
ncbi:probable Xaa-Pro aminopeptidase 3 isoform X2 [Cimex lectularius]|uniref:Aminopeptidase P N-terminal domain-containing protein n=1 Tax=Cimex lectularius TaxID=79782 RepID=A0A8I6RY88_CIMLE|nr:probable Xaa-Pro aminopeptidase 3 isoform X2 [Cimex lectularius]